jgi:hypothetical protein
VLTFGTAQRYGATRLRVPYRVAGASEAGLDKLAPAFDGVIGEQAKRLKAFTLSRPSRNQTRNTRNRIAREPMVR